MNLLSNDFSSSLRKVNKPLIFIRHRAIIASRLKPKSFINWKGKHLSVTLSSTVISFRWTLHSISFLHMYILNQGNKKTQTRQITLICCWVAGTKSWASFVIFKSWLVCYLLCLCTCIWVLFSSHAFLTKIGMDHKWINSLSLQKEHPKFCSWY